MLNRKYTQPNSNESHTKIPASAIPKPLSTYLKNGKKYDDKKRPPSYGDVKSANVQTNKSPFPQTSNTQNPGNIHVINSQKYP